MEDSEGNLPTIPTTSVVVRSLKQAVSACLPCGYTSAKVTKGFYSLKDSTSGTFYLSQGFYLPQGTLPLRILPLGFYLRDSTSGILPQGFYLRDSTRRDSRFLPQPGPGILPQRLYLRGSRFTLGILPLGILPDRKLP